MAKPETTFEQLWQAVQAVPRVWCVLPSQWVRLLPPA